MSSRVSESLFLISSTIEAVFVEAVTHKYCVYMCEIQNSLFSLCGGVGGVPQFGLTLVLSIADSNGGHWGRRAQNIMTFSS